MTNTLFAETVRGVYVRLGMDGSNRTLMIHFPDITKAKLAELSLLISFGSGNGKEEKYDPIKDFITSNSRGTLFLNKIPKEIALTKGGEMKLAYVNESTGQTFSRCFKMT